MSSQLSSKRTSTTTTRTEESTAKLENSDANKARERTRRQKEKRLCSQTVIVKMMKSSHPRETLSVQRHVTNRRFPTSVFVIRANDSDTLYAKIDMMQLNASLQQEIVELRAQS